MPIKPEDVVFYSGINNDKIVNVFEGSFNKATQTTVRTSVVGTIRVFAIPHGLTRPVFVDLVWSPNGTTWADTGGIISGTSSMAFSDNTNIYIIANSATGTQFYKAICTWIDDYDATNPSIPEYQAPEKPITFYTGDNYKKVYTPGSSTYPAGTFGSVFTRTISHPLGYRPDFKAYFEPISGEVWPMNSGGINNPFLYGTTQDEASADASTTDLVIRISRFSNATRNIWYRVYYND